MIKTILIIHTEITADNSILEETHMTKEFKNLEEAATVVKYVVERKFKRFNEDDFGTIDVVTGKNFITIMEIKGRVTTHNTYFIINVEI